MSLPLAILDMVTRIGGTAYNIWNTERSRNDVKDQQNYERQLQNTIFQREDNSIQRRVADLKAAGLNPLLAAGSGASAGSPISISSMPSAKELSTDELSIQDAISRTQANTRATLDQKMLEKQDDILDQQIAIAKANKTIAENQANLSTHDAEIKLKRPTPSDERNEYQEKMNLIKQALPQLSPQQIAKAMLWLEAGKSVMEIIGLLRKGK